MAADQELNCTLIGLCTTATCDVQVSASGDFMRSTSPVENLRNRKAWLYLAILAVVNYVLAQLIGLMRGGASRFINAVSYVAGLASNQLMNAPYSMAAKGVTAFLVASLTAFAYVGALGLTIVLVLRIFTLNITRPGEPPTSGQEDRVDSRARHRRFL